MKKRKKEGKKEKWKAKAKAKAKEKLKDQPMEFNKKCRFGLFWIVCLKANHEEKAKRSKEKKEEKSHKNLVAKDLLFRKIMMMMMIEFLCDDVKNVYGIKLAFALRQTSKEIEKQRRRRRKEC